MDKILLTAFFAIYITGFIFVKKLPAIKNEFKPEWLDLISIISGVFWFNLTNISGILLAAQFVNPELSFNYGSLKAIHLNSGLYGWVSIVYILYIFSIFKNKPLYIASIVFMNLGVIISIAGFISGDLMPKKLFESALPGKIFIFLSFLSIFIAAIKIEPKEEEIFAKLMGMLTAPVYLLLTFIKPHGVKTSIYSSILTLDFWIFWILSGIFGILYYVAKSQFNRSMFYTGLFFLYIASLFRAGVGGLYTAFPQLFEALGSVSSGAMLISFLILIFNLYPAQYSHPDRIFFLTGSISLIITGIIGFTFAIHPVNKITHFSDLVIAQAEAGFIGGLSFILLGFLAFNLRKMGYSITPHSLKTSYWHMFVGMVMLVVSLFITGFFQIASWVFSTSYEMLVVNIRTSLDVLYPVYLLRILAGFLIMVPSVIFLIETLNITLKK